jgi:CBS domain-containing protein
MSKRMREVMRPGRPDDAELIGGIRVRAEATVDEALYTMIEGGTDRLTVIDGHQIIGSVTPGELAISIEDTRTWSSLCR